MRQFFESDEDYQNYLAAEKELKDNKGLPSYDLPPEEVDSNEEKSEQKN